MKLADIGLFLERGVITIREVNKRNQPKAGGIDITKPVVDMFIAICQTPEKKIYIYEQDGKVFSIDVKELTEDQIAEFRRSQLVKSRKTAMLFAQIASYGTAFYTPFRR